MSEFRMNLTNGEQLTSPRFIIKNEDVGDLRVSDGGSGKVILTPNEIAEFCITTNEDGVPVWTVRKIK